MAATFFWALRLSCILFVFPKLNVTPKSSQGEAYGVEYPFLQNHRLSKSFTSENRVRRPIVSWGTHGLTLQAVPEHSVLLDLTIYMDVQPQPGPEVFPTNQKSGRTEYPADNLQNGTKRSTESKSFGARATLLSLRNTTLKPSPAVMSDLKSLGILRYRGRRAGAGKSVGSSAQPKNIAVVNSRRPAKQRFRQIERRNLVRIPRANPTGSRASTDFAVPKCLFTNICGLAKTKNRVRAPVALEADLRKHDIDVCVVSETHLSTGVPDSVANIPGYTLFRRDRGWGDLDKRKKGGVAIYVRNNLKVLDIYRSSLYELICTTLLLPSGHRMLISGLYNPPKHNYRDSELMSYIISIVDNVLDNHPNAVMICGGDLNRLDLQEFKALSGWDALVGFPTRGDACLDNCITNRVDLFGKAYPIHMLMKTDHKGVVLPAGTKLKPVRSKVYVRDCREHRKQALYRALAAEEWTDVKTADNINTAVDLLEHKIRTAIDKCLPRRSTRMSSRDPPWMTPLLRTMLRVKSRISPNNVERLKLINCRIAEVICQNRRSSTAVMGSQEWWKNVDLTSQRRNQSNHLTLGRDSLDCLNDYFGQLCYDDTTNRCADSGSRGGA